MLRRKNTSDTGCRLSHRYFCDPNLVLWFYCIFSQISILSKLSESQNGVSLLSKYFCQAESDLSDILWGISFRVTFKKFSYFKTYWTCSLLLCTGNFWVQVGMRLFLSLPNPLGMANRTHALFFFCFFLSVISFPYIFWLNGTGRPNDI